MKSKYKIITVVLVILSIQFSINAQTINWTSLKKEQMQIFNANAGWDFAINYGVGYGYQLKSKLPIIVNLEFSFPAGGNAGFDDHKVKIGGQARVFKFNDFAFTTKIHGVFRRYENPSVRLVNFGSDMSGIIGYYKSKWFVATEVGFDKAIVTHFKHSHLMKDNFPTIQDGWYEPSTGGNFYYGIQTGISFKQHDIYLKGGRMLTQDFKTTPTIPFYAQLGYNLKINRKGVRNKK